MSANSAYDGQQWRYARLAKQIDNAGAGGRTGGGAP